MISQFEPPAEDTLRRKRLKVTSACAECRRRKTKCDGAQPCASCNKAKVDCRYVSKNSGKETTLQTQPQQEQQPQQPRHSAFQHHTQPLKDYRRSSMTTSFNSQNLGRGMRPSISSTTSAIPPTSRHSFSHFATQPSPSRSRPSQEPQRHTPTNISTIASIEERLAAIERILRTLLESSVNQSTMVNKDLIEKGLPTNADSMKGVAHHHPYLSDTQHNTFPSTDITRDYLRLPPLYSNKDSTSASIKNHSIAPSSLSPPSPPSSSTKHGLLERMEPTTDSVQHTDNAETSTSSLPPMITGFKRPHDATIGQSSTSLQPIYVTTASLDHAVQHTTDHRSSSASLDSFPTTTATSFIPPTSTHNSQYTSQHTTLTTIPL